MPKYKEIRVDVRVSPEAILGSCLGNTAPIHAEQTAESETKPSEHN